MRYAHETLLRRSKFGLAKAPLATLIIVHRNINRLWGSPMTKTANHAPLAPKFDLDALVAFQKANLETVVAAQRIFFDLAQTVAKRHAEFVKSPSPASRPRSRATTRRSSRPPTSTR